MTTTPFKLSEDYFPERPLPKNKRCELCFHYGEASVLRQVSHAVDMLARNNDQRLVYASVGALRLLCWHYRDGKKHSHPSVRAVKYALAFLRKQGIISDRKVRLTLSYRGRIRQVKTREHLQDGGRTRSGFIVVEHDRIAKRDDYTETCTITNCEGYRVAVRGASWTVNPNAVFSLHS